MTTKTTELTLCTSYTAMYEKRAHILISNCLECSSNCLRSLAIRSFRSSTTQVCIMTAGLHVHAIMLRYIISYRCYIRHLQHVVWLLRRHSSSLSRRSTLHATPLVLAVLVQSYDSYSSLYRQPTTRNTAHLCLILSTLTVACDARQTLHHMVCKMYWSPISC